MTRAHVIVRLALVAGLALTGTGPVRAAPGDWVNGVSPAQPADLAAAIPLPETTALPNPAPEGWARQDALQRLVYNIAHPALMPVPATLAANRFTLLSIALALVPTPCPAVAPVVTMRNWLALTLTLSVSLANASVMVEAPRLTLPLLLKAPNCMAFVAR